MYITDNARGKTKAHLENNQKQDDTKEKRLNQCINRCILSKHRGVPKNR